MKEHLILWGSLGVAGLLVMIGLAWIYSLPPAPTISSPAPITKEETAATIEALRPPKRKRPLVAIIGLNEATEMTDYLMPYGIIKRADVADVEALAAEKGPVTLYPTLKVEPDATLADFDVRHPEGSDYVIVPAMSRDDDLTIAQWIREQSAKGAIIIGVCAGARSSPTPDCSTASARQPTGTISKSCAKSIRQSAMLKTGEWWSIKV